MPEGVQLYQCSQEKSKFTAAISNKQYNLLKYLNSF